MQVGSTRVTADGIVGPSGSAVRVFFVEVLSAGSAATVSVRNGTSGSGTVYSQVDGTANQAAIKNYAGGLLLPGGCYIDLDANTTFVTVGWAAE